MNAGDLENLAAMLDKNRAFERPQGQSTGFSLQEGASMGSSSMLPTNTTPTAHNTLVSTTTTSATNPSTIALPPTVVDHQLRLPQPSHGKAAERRRELAKPAAPHGDEIWTQAELQERYAQQRRDGPAPLAVAARAIGAQHAQQRPGDGGAQKGSGLWRPTAADAGSYEEPAYTVLYQQNVSAEDIYLGVDFTRDASSAASDGVTVRVELPKVAAVSDIATEVDPYELRVSVAGVYYVAAALPRKVQQTAADAVWDGQKKLLTIRLKADHSNNDARIVP